MAVNEGDSSENSSRDEEPRRPIRVSIPKRVGFWLGLGVFFSILFFVDLDSDTASVTTMAAIASLMAIWWMTEAIPIPATALIPIALFPLMGILSGQDTARRFIDRNVMLFLGGFLIALGMQRWNLHKRIALSILRVIGGQPHRLLLGFMISTAFLSMWISNTATTMMMMPMGLALIMLYEDLNEQRRAEGNPVGPREANFAPGLMLSIAFAASIGGIATKIGTPPNLVLMTVFSEQFPDAPEISFMKWMAFSLPLCIIFLFLAWLLLSRGVFPLPAESPFSGQEFIRDEMKKLGPVSVEEKRVGAVFTLTAFMWVFRGSYRAGEVMVPGWSTWLTELGVLPDGALIDDGTIAILMGLALFVLPASRSRGGRLMDWETAHKGVPWGILLLFGGGFALARGFEVSGLSAWVGQRLSGLQGAPPWALVIGITMTMEGLTELTSNTATTTTLLPILAALARSIEVNPLLLMIPGTIGASLAFMLPVATPPNAIVFGTGRVTIAQMIKAGIFMNIIGLALIMIFMFLVAVPVLDISLTEFPDWAR